MKSETAGRKENGEKREQWRWLQIIKVLVQMKIFGLRYRSGGFLPLLFLLLKLTLLLLLFLCYCCCFFIVISVVMILIVVDVINDAPSTIIVIIISAAPIPALLLYIYFLWILSFRIQNISDYDNQHFDFLVSCQCRMMHILRCRRSVYLDSLWIYVGGWTSQHMRNWCCMSFIHRRGYLLRRGQSWL